MSLFADDSRGKGRSRSRSRDRRTKEEKKPEPPVSYADVREPSYVYPEDDLDDRYNRRGEPPQPGGALPYPEEGGIYNMLPGNQAVFNYDGKQPYVPPQPTYAPLQQPAYAAPSPVVEAPYRTSRDKVHDNKLPGAFPGAFPEEDQRTKEDEPRIRYAEPREDKYGSRKEEEDAKIRHAEPRQDKYGSAKETEPRKDKYSSRKDDEEAQVRYAEPRKDKYGSRKDDPEPQVHYAEPRQDKYSSHKDVEDARIRYAEPRDDKYSGRNDEDDEKLKYLPQKYSRKYADDEGKSSDRDKVKSKDKKERRSGKDKDEDLAYGKPPVPLRPKQPNTDLAYGKAQGVPSSAPSTQSPGQATYGSYVSGDQWDTKRASNYAPREESPDRRQPVSPGIEEYGARKSRDTFAADPRGSNPNVLTVDPTSRDRDRSRDRRGDKHKSAAADTLAVVDPSSRHRDKSRDRSDRHRDKSPGRSSETLGVESSRHRDKSRDRRRDKSPGPETLGVDSGRHGREKSRDGRGKTRDKSPQPPTGRMTSLTVDTGRMAGMTVAMAPASPLLESYYGTYQDCSPMPSPLLLAAQHDDSRALEALSPLSSDNEGGKKHGRRARFHDPEDITEQLAQALKGSRPPDTGPLIHILPSLTHEQVMELRVEYKRIVKTGPEHKGVNVAKHIRARLKDEDPLLMKACYAVALGKWEGDAYWANFWYQGDKTRRELLIEALMGRTNDEVAHIKDAFTDKKYDNSLTKCMKQELKEDKFKKAVLLVLDERRMDEYDQYGRRLPIDYELVDQDVDDLRRAVKSEKGGESAMISIIVQRSDTHLRAIITEYERHYRANFARDALKKSGNLVGELLVHILNGVINRPVRDALLLHHAVSASRKDGLRRELLISRLVRFHWDPHHMQAIKRAYVERYHKDLQEAVREATSGEWGQFCRELCIARTPTEVKRFEKERMDVR
ncbi:hypothetical protein G7046_g4799 [Stylonectria norvegica]|nr:hypothetical protein G7046_g4799 [Stylonectria norvegica]